METGMEVVEMVYDTDGCITEVASRDYRLEQIADGQWWLWLKEGLASGVAIILVSRTPIEARLFKGEEVAKLE